MNKHEISEYYDNFRDTRMSRYRILGNRRLSLAANKVKSLLRAGDAVADFGCGVGIVSEEMARAREGVQVCAVDVSRANIEYARRTVKRSNIRFQEVGLTNGCEVLRELHKDGYNVIVLVDVIEHIREEDRPGLLKELASIANNNAYLVLTYPSPEYQTYLSEHRPEELQIVDNTLPRDTLLSEAGDAGWTLKSFQYVDIWMSNQYIHAVFQKGDTPLELRRIRQPWFQQVASVFKVAIQFPFRVWRYGWPSMTLKK